MIAVFFSLVGILCGFLLSKIAPEELSAGKKYFKFVKTTFYFISLIIFSIFFILNQSYLYFGVVFVLAIVLFLLQLKFKKLFLDLFTYLLFFIPAFFYQEQTFHLLLAVSLFLYGFPVGVALKSRNIYK
jgi:hypothetical protein